MGKKCAGLSGFMTDVDEFIPSAGQPGEENNNHSHHQAVLKMVKLISQKELTEKQRRAFECVYYQNLTVTDTASIMGISQSECSRLLQRGRERVKRILSYGYFPVWTVMD